MRKAAFAVLFILTILFLIWLFTQSRPQRDRVISVDDEDPEIMAVTAKARRTLPDLLEAIRTGVDSYSVSVAITDSNGTEHFWLSGVTYSSGVFSGKIDNQPGIVKCVALGQQYSVKQQDISDWLYVRGGKVTGNETLRVLLSRMSPRDAARAKKAMGWD